MTNYNNYDEWPDLLTPTNVNRLFEMYPENKLLQLHAFPVHSEERRAAWNDLGVTDPVKQRHLEDKLDDFINSLAHKRSDHAR